MKIEVKDAPGELVAALKPISEVGGNIIAVIHEWDPTLRSKTRIVQVVLDVPGERVDGLADSLKSRGVSILRIGEERLLMKRSVIMIGHLLHTDISDTVDRIDQTGFAEVVEMHMTMPGITQRSSARLTVSATNRAHMETAMEILRSVAHQKELLLVEPLEEGV
ncbi:amino acid-binding protein [Methanofollis fontis]|uniref:Amino acid-binding protein n=1 Tax=Methanofollis fontis TaxID=2052832 RepID=A0A483CP12_9EURY|nr:amino acid-binding protein [Methanofollis fontis]TAJ43838.1 amino acid-binding protein [Methanofollis fontis]